MDMPERNLAVLAESPKGALAANQLAAQDLVPADMAALAMVVHQALVADMPRDLPQADTPQDLQQAGKIVQDLDVKVLAIPDQDQLKAAAPLQLMVAVTVVKDVLLHQVQQAA